MTIQIVIETDKCIIHTGEFEPEARDFWVEDVHVELISAAEYLRVRVQSTNRTISRIRFRLFTPMVNYETIILPDSGRTYTAQTRMNAMWPLKTDSGPADVRVPLFILCGMHHRPVLAFGILGENLEGEFECIEPAKDRTQPVSPGCRLGMEISRVLPERMQQNAEFGIYIREEGILTHWVLVLRNFARIQRDMAGIQVKVNSLAQAPFFTERRYGKENSLTEERFLEDVRTGVDLGICNFILDEDWFQNGAKPSPNGPANFERFYALKSLTDRVHELKGRVILRIAPGRIPAGACNVDNNNILMVRNERMIPWIASDGDYRICPMCAKGRGKIVQEVVTLLRATRADGVKLDLDFGKKCFSPFHNHDQSSGTEAVQTLLQEISGAVQTLFKAISTQENIKMPDPIIEIEQSCGGVFMSPFADVIRAGDAPHDVENNFWRTIHIASYSHNALCDCQTIRKEENVRDAFRVAVKMMAAGIPAYCMDLSDIDKAHRKMLYFLHEIYAEMIRLAPAPWRIPVEAGMNVWRVETPNIDFLFSLNGNQILTFRSGVHQIVFNTMDSGPMLIRTMPGCSYDLSCYSEVGELINAETLTADRRGYMIFECGQSCVIRFTLA